MTSTGPWRRSCRARNTPPSSARSCRTWAIGYIGAHSPQAKGRIERLWETLQDRLVAELRLRRIQTVVAAEAYLPTYLADHNRRFTQPPPTHSTACRRAKFAAARSGGPPRAAATRAAWTATIPCDSRPGWSRSRAAPTGAPPAGCRVELRECLDGRLLVDYQETPASPLRRRPRRDFILVACGAQRLRASRSSSEKGGRHLPLGSNVALLRPARGARRSGRASAPLSTSAPLAADVSLPATPASAAPAAPRRNPYPHPVGRTFSLHS